MDLTVRIGSASFRNPIMVASGTFGYGMEFRPVVDLSKIGAIVTKTITVEPRKGNPPSRIYELPAGLLNSIGLQNDGLADFLQVKLPKLREMPTAKVVSIGGKTLQEFETLAAALDGVGGVDALELNISCPNLSYKQGMKKESECLHFAQDPEMAAEVVAKLKARTRLPVIAKLSPNVTDIGAIAQACEAAGADALTVANTYFGMAVNIWERTSQIGTAFGGVSGPCIKAQSLYQVYRCRRACNVPIIGSGGIETLNDVLEFVVLGACAVQLGTVNFIDPTTAQRVAQELPTTLTKLGVKQLGELVGSFRAVRDPDFI